MKLNEKQLLDIIEIKNLYNIKVHGIFESARYRTIEIFNDKSYRIITHISDKNYHEQSQNEIDGIAGDEVLSHLTKAELDKLRMELHKRQYKRIDW